MVKKTGSENINSKLALVMKSGKYVLGYKSTLRALRSGDAKLILLSNNCPVVRKAEIEYYAVLAKAKVVFYQGNNTALGTACGRYHRCSTLAILDAGDSDILNWLFIRDDCKQISLAIPIYFNSISLTSFFSLFFKHQVGKMLKEVSFHIFSLIFWDFLKVFLHMLLEFPKPLKLSNDFFNLEGASLEQFLSLRVLDIQV